MGNIFVKLRKEIEAGATHIEIPNGVTEISHNIVSNCDNLKEFHVPEHLINMLSFDDREIYDKL